VRYTRDFFFDRYEWDVQKGQVYFEGTELFRADIEVVEQVVTEAQ
jgi:hypothetical protein